MTLLSNARVFGNPGADSVLIDGERIAALGLGLARGLARGPDGGPDGDKVIDLQGMLLTPGLNDAHLHLMRGAALGIEVDLRDARSPREMAQRINERAAVTPRGEWVTGRGWDHTLWPRTDSAEPWPTRAMLDAVSSEHPMYFSRIDIHVAVANTAALRIAGASERFPDGLLREEQMAIVRGKIPPHSKPRKRDALLATLRDFARLGITSCQDNSTWDDYLLYREMEAAGEWTLRVAEWFDFGVPGSELVEKREVRSRLFHTGLCKGFSDGSLGSRTAALLAPYSDDASTKGILRFDPATLPARVRELDAAGFQIGLHAIGDAAVRMCLDAFEGVAVPEKRHRIEHAQIVTGADLPRFARLGLIASVQPCHWLSDRRWAAERLGERLRLAYRWKDFLDAGVPIAIGTDFPVEPADPAANFEALAAGPNGITRDEAISAYTLGAAYAEFTEHEKGRIAPGYLADLVAWDADSRAALTMLGGEVIFKTW